MLKLHDCNLKVSQVVSGLQDCNENYIGFDKGDGSGNSLVRKLDDIAGLASEKTGPHFLDAILSQTQHKLI